MALVSCGAFLLWPAPHFNFGFEACPDVTGYRLPRNCTSFCLECGTFLPEPCTDNACGLDASHLTGIFWVMLNNFFAVTDRLLQRLMLAKDQEPVDMSRTSITLVNNVVGMIPTLLVAVCTKEYVEVLPAMRRLSGIQESYIAISCVIGAGIAYTGIWAQSLISATSFLVLSTGNKFGIILLEMYVMHTKQLTPSQVAGACIVIGAGVAYGKAISNAQEAVKRSEESSEVQPLLAKKV